MGLARFLLVRTVEVMLIIVLILVMPSIPPNSTFTSFKVTPAQELKGKLAINNRLDNVDHLYEDQLKGAEAFAEYNGELYSSLYTGEVVKFSKGHIVPIVHLGKPCAGHHEERICGRPLGLEFDRQGILYVTDAYYGIWRVDVKTGQKTQLVSMDQEIEGKKPMLPNSITLSENGDFYWTDSSTQFHLDDGLFDFLSDGTGRLIHYNAETKTNKVLMDGLHFANGVKLSSGEEFLIVSETKTSRIYRYYLKGPKAGTHDIFADGLPGLPDNINTDGQDGFFVSCISARDSDHPNVPQVIAPHPWLRKFIARILGITEATFKTIHKMYPTMYSQWAIHLVGHFETSKFFLPSRSTVLHYAKNGELIGTLHGMDDTITGISDAFVHGDHLYLGHPFNTFVGRVSLSKSGLEHLRRKREVPVQQKVEPKVERVKVTTPKPKVVTPAPVRETRNEPPAPQMRPDELKVITKSPPIPSPTQPTPIPQKQPPANQKQTAPPKEQPAANQKQTPPPAVHRKQPPPPQKQSPPPAATQQQPPPPQKQSPPPAATQQQPPPPQKQSPPPAGTQQQPPPPQKQSPPPAANQKQPPPPAASQKQPPPSQKQSPPPAATPKVVPVKENSVPKPRV